MSFRIRDTSFQQPEPEQEQETECVENKKTEHKTSKKKEEKKSAKISISSGFQMKYDHTNQCDHF